MQNSDIKASDCPVLKTERLLLRGPDARDVGAIVSIAGDWEVSRRLGRVPHPYSEKDARFFLETVVPNELTWAITWPETGELIGMVGLKPEAGGTAAELGYWVARRWWGIGIATEAARAVVDYAFDTLQRPWLTAGYFLDNPASGRVLGKLGFVETGPEMRPCLAVGSTLPSMELQLEAGRRLCEDGRDTPL